MFRQCKLQQDTQFQTAWIELRGAKVGKIVELKDGSGYWNVVEAYDHVLNQKQLQEFQENSRNFKKKTDY